MTKPRHVWVDKFHPNNGRLYLQRTAKMSVADLKAWIKLGRKEIRRYTLRDEFFMEYRGFPARLPTQISMRYWCEWKVRQLLRMVDRGLR